MAIKGRGTDHNPHNRFAPRISVADATADAQDAESAAPSFPETTVRAEEARSIISYNQSPDIHFDRSINPYRGCEHGCIYCFARPSHAYLDLSPGLDFETRLTAKTNAPDVLRRELAKPGYRCAPIALGVNTDAYQPIEKQYRLTRQLLEVLWEHRHPCTLITKSQLICDDLPLLAQMAREKLVKVNISVTTLDDDLKRKLEPRAASGNAHPHDGAARRRGHSGRSIGGADDSGAERQRARSHSRGGQTGRCGKRFIHSAATAAGSERAVRTVAAGAFSATGHPCDEPGATEPRRQELRFAIP
jgi:hypothetical protein